MGTKKINLALAAALALGILVGLLPDSDGTALYALAAPFSLAGRGLRALSLSGAAGNAAAWVLYAGVCLSPLLLLRRRREDSLLVLGSGVLFYVMYQMINPSRIPAGLGSLGEVIYAGAVVSVFAAWGVLRLLGSEALVREQNAYRALRLFLLICAGECVLAGIGMRFGSYRTAISRIEAANTMPGLDLTFTYLFVFLDELATAVEYGLDALVMLFGAALLRELERDAYSGECAALAEKTVYWCRRSLVVIVLMNLALNLGQVMLASVLHQVEIQVRVPVLSMALVFAAMTLTRLLSQGKALKDDNDLFI